MSKKETEKKNEAGDGFRHDSIELEKKFPSVRQQKQKKHTHTQKERKNPAKLTSGVWPSWSLRFEGASAFRSTKTTDFWPLEAAKCYNMERESAVYECMRGDCWKAKGQGSVGGARKRKRIQQNLRAGSGRPGPSGSRKRLLSRVPWQLMRVLPRLPNATIGRESKCIVCECVWVVAGKAKDWWGCGICATEKATKTTTTTTTKE